MTAGQIALSKQSVRKTVSLDGAPATAAVTVTNTGGRPATVRLGEQSGGFSMQSTPSGAPKQLVKTDVSPLRHNGAATGTAPQDDAPSADAWTPIANAPTTLQDNAVSVNGGKLYSAYGFTGSGDIKNMYIYDPAGGTWTQGASASDNRSGDPAHGFIGGKFYAVGGWADNGTPDTKLEIYDPSSDTWSTGATAPKAFAGAGSVVLGSKLYSIGGCTSECGQRTVMVYDSASDTWSQAADYPEAISWESCGAIAGKIYCAGGIGSASTRHGYVYDPNADTWSPIADLPLDLWGSAYAAANGRLLVSSGVADNSSAVSNQGFAYDPDDNTWTPLPNANEAVYRSGSALGFYRIGGSVSSSSPPVATGSVLAGYDQGGDTDVTWLSLNRTTFTLAPGASRKLKITVDPTDPAVAQPGDYTAAVSVGTDTPYSIAPIGVTMHATPPSTWGKITGTVSADDGHGTVTPLSGASVEIDGWSAGYLVKTDSNGHFALWMDSRNSPLTVIFARDGYHPQVKTATIKEGKTVTVDVTLLRL
ncbi:hypothetical protein Athai_44310 [Actinocatenispora thailandica]|uniref:Galactose oxidase n=1 Tax=Actinocatenispora thailandica TaxID=227318 RepID=A0A7R7DSC9_9ACTN|nr:carboxypeptidase regulatory-like domain-containing protein [Actinocatenispora thailandica]BCJ36928.1 hypothetical protein Athai_44310 [Actinocatenispora thailandica]